MALVSCPECSKSVSDITLTMCFIMIVALGFSFISCAKKTSKDYPIKPVLFTEVQVKDEFWQSRMETNRRVTIPFAFKKSEETGRIDNFAKAGGLMPGAFEGRRYNDSDVFKIMEGAAYSLTIHPDPELEKYMDDLIVKIAAAQEEDGYLFTTRTIEPDNPAPGSGEKRWSNLASSHELYNVGHMYEAAVAYYLVTGKRNFLDVALKNADLIAREFGPGKRQDFPGHQEIEIGLVKLFRLTGDEKYLSLAKFFLDVRGPGKFGKKFADDSDFSIYNQDWYYQAHMPVVEQTEAVGHAVRATYMYSGMADVAALTGDKDYIKAIDQIWENVVSKKLYVTGGIGSRHEGEAFGANYELPNATAYNETCAAIGNVFWNYRLFLLHGDAKYIDVLERTLYNGLISGLSLSGDLFFYPNPLESNGKYTFNQGEATRKPWFDCACCPVNLARLLPSIPGYVYAHKKSVLYINLFVEGEGRVDLKNTSVKVSQKTDYPWDGHIHINIDPETEREFEVLVRIPGWARNEPVPSDLYAFSNPQENKVVLRVNSETWPLDLDKGFAKILRKWQGGDTIELDLPMPVRRVVAHHSVEDNQAKVALQRGPLVYCFEGIDNGGHILNRSLPDDMDFAAKFQPDFLGGIVVIQDSAPDGSAHLTAIPYYAWSHRGVGEMSVWLPRK
ncbi:MAG: glycoside hydrolase family 127 protein [Candidatus Aminicenantaceae bacterium]